MRNVLQLTSAEVRALITPRLAVEALWRLYTQRIPEESAPPRSIARGDGVWCRALIAALPDGSYMGGKVFGRGRRGGVSYVVLLFDQESGQLVAILDGDAITALRTSATSAVAVKATLGGQRVRMGLLGSGKEAYHHVLAIREVVDLSGVSVYSPTREHRETLAKRLNEEHGLVCVAVEDPREAVAGCELVVAACRPRQEVPALELGWLDERTKMVVSVGSTLPEQRELDERVLGAARVIVLDSRREVLHETGDFLAATKAGWDLADRVVTLDQWVRRTEQGWSDGLVVYKSAGHGVQDVALAAAVYSRAVSGGKDAGRRVVAESGMR